MCSSMSDKKVWFVTGAGRGLGVDIAKAALAAGHAVVATGRNTEKVSEAIGEHDDLLAVKLDVTDPADAEAAVAAAVDRFGRIDVLVNNAGNFHAGFFEELTPEEFRAQIETNLFGPVNVTRAALPVMRAQRSGLVVTISSTAGLGAESSPAPTPRRSSGWRAGWSRWPRGCSVRHPHDAGRARLLPHRAAHAESTKYAASSIDDYAERTEQTVTAWKGMNGQQGGDPAKLADALVHLAGRRSRRCASPPAPTRSTRSREGPRTCSPRPTLTATCPAASPSIRLVRPNQFDLKAEQPIEQPKDLVDHEAHSHVGGLGQSRWLHRGLPACNS